MPNGKKRERKPCIKCGQSFSFLPRTDGQPQRDKCYVCKPRPAGDRTIVSMPPAVEPASAAE